METFIGLILITMVVTAIISIVLNNPEGYGGFLIFLFILLAFTTEIAKVL